MSGGRVTIGAGTLYTALSTLLKKGLIEHADTSSGVDARRKMYTITADGRKALATEIERLEELLQNGRHVISRDGRVDRGGNAWIRSRSKENTLSNPVCFEARIHRIPPFGMCTVSIINQTFAERAP